MASLISFLAAGLNVGTRFRRLGKNVGWQNRQSWQKRVVPCSFGAYHIIRIATANGCAPTSLLDGGSASLPVGLFEKRCYLAVGWVQAELHTEQLQGSAKVLAYMVREWKGRSGQLVPLDDLRKCVRTLRRKVRALGAYGESEASRCG